MCLEGIYSIILMLLGETNRSLSGSYSLKKGDKNYNEYLDSLSKLFEKYSKDNVFTMTNKTVAYIGRMD